MSIEILSILALVIIFAIATALPINMGALALAATFIVGSLAVGLTSKEIFEGFPGDLFVTLVGITYLFAIARNNGSVDRLVHGAVRLVRGHVAAIPWVCFIVTAALTGVGALGPAAVAIIAPVALSLAVRYKISPLMIGLMVIHGAQAGAFSPISVYGGITNKVVERAGIPTDPAHLFLASLSFNFVIALIVFFIFGGAHMLRGNGKAHPEQPALAVAGDGPIAGAAAPRGLAREQLLTFVGLSVVAVGGLMFDFNVGLVAISVAAALALVAPKSQARAIDQVSWSTVLLICGVITYVGVLEKAGTVDYVSASIAAIGAPLLATLLLCYLGGVVSAFASSTALLGIVIPLAVPFLKLGDISALGVVAAIAISTTIVDTSPFSTNGAIVVANAEPGLREKIFRQLLIYSAVITGIGPLVAWILFILPG